MAYQWTSSNELKSRIKRKQTEAAQNSAMRKYDNTVGVARRQKIRQNDEKLFNFGIEKEQERKREEARKKAADIEQRRNNNDESSAYLTLKMAEANSGKVPVNYIPYSKSSPIDPSWSVGGSDKIDFSNDDYWIYDSGETLENFTPLNEAERKRYLEVTKIDGVKISGNLDENVKVLGNININDRNARIRALSYAYQSGDITTEEQNELVSLLSIGTEADQKRVDEAVKNNTLDTFKPENLAQERLYKKAVESETVDNMQNMSLDELKNFSPNNKEEAKAYYNYINTDNFAAERNTATGELIGADDYEELFNQATKYAVKYDIAAPADKEWYLDKRTDKLKEKNADKFMYMPDVSKITQMPTLEEWSDFLDGNPYKNNSKIENIIGSIGNGMLKGAASIGAGIVSIPKMLEDFMGADSSEMFGGFDLTEWLYEQGKNAVNEYDEESTLYNRALGMSEEASSIVTSLESAVGQALYYFAIYKLLGISGGITAAGTATTGVNTEWLMTNATRQNSSAISKTVLEVGNAMKTLVKNPSFQLSYWTELPDDYFEAVENGADKNTAMAQANFTALLNAAIEVGSGIETGETSLIKNIFGESKEEIYQGVVSNLTDKATYASDMPWISTDGSDAVFNVKELLLSGLAGAVGGAAGGGMIKGVNYISNPVTKAQQYKTYGDNLKTNTDILGQYAQYALENGSNRDVKTANEIISAINEGQLDSIPSVKVGKFAQNAAKLYQNKYIAAIAQEESGANIKEKTKSASEIYNTLQNIYTNPEFILNDTRAIMIRKNKVAAEALSRSAGLNSTINAETPVSTVKTIARMVSNGVNVNNNQSINVDSTGRVSSTVTPTQIDIEAAQRIKNGNGSLSDYLSVTGKTLNDYRDSEGEVNASALSREAHEIIENSDVLTNTENNRLTEILNSRRLLNSHGENNISVNNISGLERVAPQNIVEIKDGNITLDNGRTVSAESVPFTAAAKALYTASARYKDNTKAVFISGFEGGNLNNYIKNFSNVYDIYAMKSKLTDEERYKSVNAFKQILGEKVFNAARQAGIEARNEREAAKSRQNEQKATEPKKNEGKNKSSQKGSESKRKYSIKNPTYTQDDLKNNAIAVRNMKSVKNLKGNEFDGDGKLTDRIDSYFAKLGNNVYSEELGDVALSKTSRRSDLRHGTTRKKVSSYIAIPEVIQEGKVVAVIPKELSERIIVAAPITINNEPYYMGVMLQRDGQNQRLYLHDVITEKETAISTEDNLITTRSSANNDSLYMTSILRKALNVNNSISEKAENDTKKDLPQNKNTVNASVSEKASKKGVITESYKEEWVLDRKDKATESVIKQIAYEYTKRGINVEIAYVENGHNGQWNPKTNTVIVNLAANNPIEAFLHEATGHVIHDYANENWQDIKTAAFTYLASIEDVSIDDIRNHKIDQYKKNKLSYTEELIDEEIVSDMIGVMAQNKNSVKELYNSLIQSGTEETLAQRIVRKLKELLMKLKLHFVNLNGKYNSAISKVAKENRPSDNAFSEYLNKINSILSQSFENLQVTENGEAKYSIKYTTENKPVVVIKENILEDVPKNEWIKTVKGIMSEKFSDGIPISGRLIKVNAITRNEFTNSKNSKYYRGHNRTVYADKFKSANNLDEIVLASTNYVNEDLMHERKDNFKEFARGDVLIRVGDNDYSAKVVVGFTSGREMVLYDVIDFKSASFSIKKVGAHTVQSQNAKNRRNATPTNNNISQNNTVVNNSISENGENDTKFSIRETDSGEKIVVVDTDQGIFLNTDEKEQIKIATKYMNDNFKNKHLPLSDYNVVLVNKTGINKYRYKIQRKDDSINVAKYKASTELDNLLKVAEYSYHARDAKNYGFAEYGFDYYTVKFVVGGQMFEGRLDIGVSPQGATFYGMNKIKRVTESTMVLANLVLEDTQSSHRNSLNNNNISQNDTVVNNSISENDEDIKFSLKEKNTTIIEQLKQAKDKLDKMSPVIEINENRGLKNNIDKINYAVESFEKFDYQVHREDIGKVVIDKKRAKRALGYLSNNQEILAFKAVPNVIESGIVIDTRPNHKGRQYATVTVAAPIILNGDRANVAVVISKTTDNFYKVHRVLFPDNSSIEFLENKKTGFKTIGATLNDSAHAQSGNPVNNNISQNNTVVNNSISENGENDTKFSLKEDVDKIQGVAYNNTKTLREHNEYDDFMPSGAMGKEIRNKIIQSFANKNFGNEAAIVDFYFGDYRMTVSYVSPTDYKLIDFYEIENEKERNIDVKRNRRSNSGYSSRQGGNGRQYAQNDGRLSRNRGTAKENARVSKSQSERNGGGYSGRTDVHNGQTEATEAEREIKKYSLLDDVEIEKAKKAYERNRKLQAYTKLVRKLFKDAGTVLDKSKTDAIADTLAKRYEVKDAKLKNLLKDKLYAYYTYVASEDANDAQIALYGHEIAQDIAAMSEEITENPSDNFFEEYGESICDVISLDVAREYAEKAIIKAPKDLEQEHKEILREYRKLKDSGDDTKAIYKELKDKTDELVKARKQYVKSRSEVMELRELLRKTKRFYERKLDKQKASRKADSQTSKVVDKDGKSGIIRVGEASDFNEMKSYMSQKHNISIDNSVCELDFETCQKSLNGFEAVCDEYPELSNKVQKIKITHDGVMSCTGDTININPEYFKSSKDLDEICKEQSKKGFWIRNASPDSLMVHESGHAVESLLIEANPNYAYDFQRTIAWQDCTEAKNIISKAVKEIKETEYGKGKKKIDLISAISRYALCDDSEALAEAFADVYANGDDANILSLKIKEITKAQFEQYRKGGSL